MRSDSWSPIENTSSCDISRPWKPPDDGSQLRAKVAAARTVHVDRARTRADDSFEPWAGFFVSAVPNRDLRRAASTRPRIRRSTRCSRTRRPLRPVARLRVALGNLDQRDAEIARERRPPGLAPRASRCPCRASAREIEERLLHEMRDEPRVRAVIHDRGR